MVMEMRAEGERVLAAAALQVAARYPSVDVRTHEEVHDARQMLLDLSAQARTVVVGSRGRGPVRSLLLGSVSAAVARHARCPVVVVRPHDTDTDTDRRGVLVGADGTFASLPTVELAYRAASVRRLPLTVMHCVDDVLAQTTSTHLVTTAGPDLDGARLALAESVAGMAEKYPDVQVRLEVCRGTAAYALSAAADTMDLLVVGRRLVGALSRLVTPDVSGYLVEHARTVVMVVPETSGHEV
jgi:nucleotide-binding universal stress UspA family protein